MILTQEVVRIPPRLMGGMRTPLAWACLILSLCLVTPGIASAARPVEATASLNAALGSSCGGAPAGGTLGTVWLRRLPGNLVSVKVRITGGLPDETYTVNVTCQGAIGTLATDAAGRGTIRFAATGNLGLSTSRFIVIDIHLASDGSAGKAQTPTLDLPLIAGS